jgi:hypothetical protein
VNGGGDRLSLLGDVVTRATNSTQVRADRLPLSPARLNAFNLHILAKPVGASMAMLANDR